MYQNFQKMNKQKLIYLKYFMFIGLVFNIVACNFTSNNDKSKIKNSSLNNISGNIINTNSLPPASSTDQVLELKFEDNLNDTSGNGIIAEWGNGEGAFVEGVEGKALDLTGDKYIVIKNSDLGSNYNEMTISFWAKEVDATETSEVFLFDKYDTNNWCTIFDVRRKHKSFRSLIDTADGTKNADIWRNIDNNWHQYAVVYDGSFIRLYKDGQEQFENGKCPVTQTGNIESIVADLYIGVKHGGQYNYFNGYIDEIKIYNKALSKEELFEYGNNGSDVTLKVETLNNEFKTNKEVLFSVSSTNLDLYHSSITWDFGDGNKTISENGIARGGVAITHFYNNPGQYTITLSITEQNQTEPKIYTQQIYVHGNKKILLPEYSPEQVLELKFENNLIDTSGNPISIECRNGDATYVDGVDGQAIDLTGNRYLVINNTDLTNNYDEMTISFWAKEVDASATGEVFLLDKYDTKNWEPIFDVRRKEASFRSLICTDTGNKSASIWRNVNQNWNHYIIIYDGTYIKIYKNGKQQFEDGKCPVAQSGKIKPITEDLYIGAKHGGQYNFFNGYIDELKIYKKALSEKEITVGFELWHADFHGHIAQYIYAQIPEGFTKDPTNKLYAEIKGGSNTYRLNDESNVLTLQGGVDNLDIEEKILLKNSELPGIDSPAYYTLTVQLLDKDNNVLREIKENFSKTYNGIPKVGIDENNSIRINGQLFFPITPCGLESKYLVSDLWGPQIGEQPGTNPVNTYINSIYRQGFYGVHGPSQYTIEGWQEYLGITNECNLWAIGPGQWQGLGQREFWRNADLLNLEDYVTSTMNDPAMLMWQWADEPDLGDDQMYLPATVLRSWTYKCHQLDPHRLVKMTLAGPPWTNVAVDWYKSRRREYAFSYNKTHFGKNTNVADIIGIDYYPIDWAAPHSRNAKMAHLADALDNLKAETYNLVPITSWVETTDINEYPYPTQWDPTPEQLKMMIWLNVVHGAKMISYFHFHTRTPDNNFAVMEEFKTQIQDLTDVVLGPESNTLVNITQNIIGDEGRVDIMIRETSSHLYIIAVRLTEIDENGNSIGNNEQISFQLPNSFANKQVSVYEKSRSLTVNTNSILTDNFAPNDVNIYVIDK